jgi:hypothetical protein
MYLKLRKKRGEIRIIALKVSENQVLFTLFRLTTCQKFLLKARSLEAAPFLIFDRKSSVFGVFISKSFSPRHMRTVIFIYPCEVAPKTLWPA